MKPIKEDRKKFDIDLEYGEIREDKIKDMLTGKKIEVKSEKGMWMKTGNICIEYESWNKPSGIRATESDYWFHNLCVGDNEFCTLVFKTDVLRTIVDDLDSFKTVCGGDHNASRMFLVNLQKLFSSDVIKAFKETEDEKNKKTLDTLVEDIYNELSALGKGEHLNIDEESIEQFGESMKEILYEWSHPSPRGKPSLRMSNIGKQPRQLWYEMNSESDNTEVISPPTFIKFLYGHLLEEIVLFLVKLSGHEVTSEQKEITVSGIKGHMDCVIDGEVVDVKTASNYAFKKFKDGTLAEDDPFGYMAQLAGYESAEGTTHGGFLALNKESGELAMFKPDNFDKPNIKKKITNIKKAVKLATPPDKCYDDVPDGKSGNMKLARGCTWCRFKHDCHKDANDGKGLRVFKYSTGYRYLTQVPKVPNVIEVTQI